MKTTIMPPALQQYELRVEIDLRSASSDYMPGGTLRAHESVLIKSDDFCYITKVLNNIFELVRDVRLEATNLEILRNMIAQERAKK